MSRRESNATTFKESLMPSRVVHSLAARTFSIGFALLAVVCVAAAQQAIATPEPSLRIRDIRVIGTQTASPSVVISFSGLHIGDVITGNDQIARAIRNIMDRRLFSDVKIFAESQTAQGAVIVIAVQEYPRIASLKLEG